MQNIIARYDRLATSFYGLYRGVFHNKLFSPYLYYAWNITRTHFPKLAYNNPYEPEYTRPLVKYNAVLVLSIVTVTSFFISKTVNE
jgi:hypothetical protein